MHTIEARSGMIVATVNRHVASGRRRVSPISITLVISVVIAAGYAAFRRIDTTANTDVIEYTQNIAGGFLAVGMTEDQPGFIVLSLLDQGKVDVNGAQTMNFLPGTHTVVEIRTPLGTQRTRLRGAQVLLVSNNGAVEKHTVDWTIDDFNALREAADCSHKRATGKHRCGAPFADLHELVAAGRIRNVPENVRTFLEQFADRN